jgi:hypothetical protein
MLVGQIATCHNRFRPQVPGSRDRLGTGGLKVG